MPNGADLIARTLSAAGVKSVFAKDHQLTRPIVSAARALSGVRVISPVSETTAVPMADGCTRYTGRPAVAITAGHGHALSQAVGIASAWADKSPVITISVSPSEGTDSSPIFDREKWDGPGTFSAITRWQGSIRHAVDIVPVLTRAVREATSARCGPVHVQVDTDAVESLISNAPEEELIKSLSRSAQAASPPVADPEMIERAYKLLASARRPLILAGGGTIRAGAVTEVNELARRTGIPITSTMGGMGAALPDNPSYMGAASYLSGEAFHTAIKEADVVLAMGVCFSGLDGFGLPPLWSPKIKFIQANIWHEDIAINPNAEIALIGDAKQTASAMLELAPRQAPDKESEWLSKLRKLDRQHLDRIYGEASRDWKLIHPAAAAEAMREVFEPTEPLVVLDGGNTALWAGMLIPVPGPRRGFFPVGMGTLGLGIPVALGIKSVAGDRPVILASGDGAFMYNIQEMETMLNHDIPFTAVVFNDSAWNMIRAGQAMSGNVYGTDLPDQDYASVAKSFGISCKRVTKKEELLPTFKEARDSGGPSIIDVVTDPDSLPDSLISFARVEFHGAKMPPAKMLKSLFKGKTPMDVRGLNLLKFIIKTV